MTRTQQHLGPQTQPTQTGRTDRHPPWCDLTRCTANPDSQTGRYRADAGGDHLSAPVSVNLTTAVLLAVRDGTAWLSQACAPWTCDTYLRVQVGDVHLSMPAADARQVLADLSAPLALTATAEGVTR
jgi:hypothetical protein